MPPYPPCYCLPLPAGESLVRQFLLGQAFFQKHLGGRSDIFWYVSRVDSRVRVCVCACVCARACVRDVGGGG